MRQLILDLLPESPPSLDNFVAGGNGEALATLTGWLAGALPEASLCLWGEPGCGRSHRNSRRLRNTRKIPPLR